MTGSKVPGRPFSSMKRAKYVRGAFADALGLDGDKPENRAKFQSIIRRVIDMAQAGDLEAVKIVFDRLDGKVAQQLTVAGEDDDRLIVSAITSNMSLSDASRMYKERLKTVGGEVIESPVERIEDVPVIAPRDAVGGWVVN